MIKDKEYYIDIFNKKWDSSLNEADKNIKENGGSSNILSYIATEIFEETANAEEIVGYYIMYHKDSALRDWTDNIQGLHLTEQDIEVNRILMELYDK